VCIYQVDELCGCIQGHSLTLMNVNVMCGLTSLTLAIRSSQGKLSYSPESAVYSVLCRYWYPTEHSRVLHPWQCWIANV